MAAPHQFLHAALLDFLLLIGFLLAVLVGRHKLAALLGVAAIASLLYTPRYPSPAYPPPRPMAVDTSPVSLLLRIGDVPMDEQWAAIASGVLAADKGAEWTWTNQRPRLRFRIDEARRWVSWSKRNRRRAARV